jgi:hypothetical protein
MLLDSEQAGALTESLREYLAPYVHAWGSDSLETGDAFDDCVNYVEATDFMVRGIVELLAKLTPAEIRDILGETILNLEMLEAEAAQVRRRLLDHLGDIELDG